MSLNVKLSMHKNVYVYIYLFLYGVFKMSWPDASRQNPQYQYNQTTYDPSSSYQQQTSGHQSIYPPPTQQTYVQTTQPKKGSKKKKVIAVLIVVIILVVAIAGVAIYMVGNKNVIEFKDVEVEYHAIFSLDSISVEGSVVNKGDKDISFDDVRFLCGGSFLLNGYEERLTTIYHNSEDRTLSKGESVQFTANLGGVESSASSTTSPFRVQYKNVNNDEVIIDVGPYYK